MANLANMNVAIPMYWQVGNLESANVVTSLQLAIETYCCYPVVRVMSEFIYVNFMESSSTGNGCGISKNRKLRCCCDQKSVASVECWTQICYCCKLVINVVYDNFDILVPGSYTVL